MTRTRKYEALVIVKAAGTEQEIAQAGAQIEESVKRLGGTIESTQNLGRRRLAFRISRQAEGYYYLLRFDAPTQTVAELERQLRLNEAVVRFIVLTEDQLAGTTITRNLPPSARRGGYMAAAFAGPERS
jgi:small subunit ribosomal protein S6